MRSVVVDMVLSVSKQPALTDPEMMKAGNIEHIMAAIAVRIKDAVGLQVAGNYPPIPSHPSSRDYNPVAPFILCFVERGIGSPQHRS